MIDAKRETPAQIPATHARLPVPTMLSAAVALALVRLLSSYIWLNGAFIGPDAKFAPDFLAGQGLASRITGGFVHTALTSGIASWLTSTVVPHASLFAWLLALGEAAVGISMLLGLFTRLGSVLAIAQAIVNILVVGGAGADTIGQNYLLIILSLAFIAAAAGRTYGIDGILIRRFPNSRFLRLLA